MSRLSAVDFYLGGCRAFLAAKVDGRSAYGGGVVFEMLVMLEEIFWTETRTLFHSDWPELEVYREKFAEQVPGRALEGPRESGIR